VSDRVAATASAGRPIGLSVCFPAYNEEATIARVLEEASALLERSGLDYEIIVCDDASTDRTGVIADEAAARHPAIRVLHHAQNRGIRDTFEDLYREAAKEWVFLNATDGQWDTAVLFDLLPGTDAWDVLIAARRDTHYGPLRAAVSWGYNLVPRRLFGVSVHDAGAVKLMRREIITRFPLVSRSPFAEAERLIRAARAGYRITERVTDTHPRGGRSRGVRAGVVAAALVDVVRVWRALRAERRGPGGAPAVTSPEREDPSHAHRR
jgi:glycosyltransferase involved in cell wall biosynthesis